MEDALLIACARAQVRNGLTRLSKATEEHKPLLGHLLYVAQLVAKQGGLCC
jgi:histidine triad (HIT) family protein